MLALNGFQNSPIPYQPLPDNAYQAARDSIVSLGFSKDAILDDYSFSTQDGQSVKINALAFAHPTRRTPEKYAGFTLYNAVDGLDDQTIVQILTQIHAPFHLIHRHSRFSFWASGIENNRVQPIQTQSDIDYTQLNSVFSEYAVDLKPQRIVDVKQGFAKFTHPAFASIVQPLQLSLWAVNVTRPLLVKHFGQAVSRLREYLKEEEIIVDIATQLLGATILADTGVLGDEVRKQEQNLRLSTLIQAAHDRFSDYFEEQLFRGDHFKVIEEAYRILRQISYAGFVPEMLTELYTEAYDTQWRKELGRYDTPLYLTHRIWETIPVEFLPPEQRVVADMTCGWGSFLLAGYERLSRLGDMQSLSLRKYLYGNDKEPLAAKLAGLGLLISTSEDSWHVDAEDVAEWEWLSKNQPNIIVGNPPFEGNRKKPSSEKQRNEKANAFLKRAINRLAGGGYLAMIMPRSFVAAEASPKLRKLLVEKCDILELWEIPTNMFDATVRTSVVFAQKKAISSQSLHPIPVRVRTIQPDTAERFKRLGTFTISGLVGDQTKWDERSHRGKENSKTKNTYVMEYKLILPESEWQNICLHCTKLEDWAIIFNGVQPGEYKGKYPQPDEYPKQIELLSEAKSVLKHDFHIDYAAQTSRKINYPENLWRPRLKNAHLLAGHKIIVTSNHDPSWGKRTKVAIERKGFYPSDNFWILAPNQKASSKGITHEVLAAVLNWKVSNAWIVEHMRHPKLPGYAIKTVPFPHVSQTDCQILRKAVKQLEDARLYEIDIINEANRTIDIVLKSAYQLDDETFERLNLIYEWDDNPQITLDPPHPADEATWAISGVVDQVDAKQGTITLWLDGFDELQTVPIHPAMPGWMLRPEAAFRTKIPRDCAWQQNLDKVAWGQFYPQNYTYMSEEELFADLTTVFHPEASE